MSRALEALLPGLWAAFGKAMNWTRVKDIAVKSWLGEEYWRLRGDLVGLTCGQSYGILQQAMINYALWVDQANGIDVWKPAALASETFLGIPY